jgi:pimeloyl-ACP methyl ester carboxylesterase
MLHPPPQFLEVGAGRTKRRIAYLNAPAAPQAAAGILWLCGFKSEMTGTKASALAAWAQPRGLACLRFDYSGHGRSEGRLEDGRIGHWLEETRAVFCRLSRGPQVLVGSSMGGWLALLLVKALMAEAADEAERIKGMLLLAPAWDMTDLIWAHLPAGARREIRQKGVYERPSRYGDGPYPITRTLIDEGRRHRLGRFNPGRPVHVLHGLKDPDVPFAHTLDLVAHLDGDWTRVTSVPDGEHRLSRGQDINLLLEMVGNLIDAIDAPGGERNAPSPA